MSLSFISLLQKEVKGVDDLYPICYSKNFKNYIFNVTIFMVYKRVLKQQLPPLVKLLKKCTYSVLR